MTGLLKEKGLNIKFEEDGENFCNRALQEVENMDFEQLVEVEQALYTALLLHLNVACGSPGRMEEVRSETLSILC